MPSTSMNLQSETDVSSALATQPRCTLAILTPQEQRDLFPGESHDTLCRIVGDVTIVDPTGLDAGEFSALLFEHKPEILVACWKTPPLPEQLPSSLRYLCYLAGSVRKLVARKHVEDGLLVTNWGNSISRIVAECALLMILSSLRRANAWTLDMHLRGAWKNADTRTFSLFERRVGIHGFGRIAQHLVKLLRPFDPRTITTYSPSVPDPLLDQHGVTRAHSLEQLFSGSEVIVELEALTPKSVHMVREEHLRLIPDPAVFVNVGRGAVVEPQGLLNVAREGRVQFALDVFEIEPLPADFPLRGLPNVMLLPHLGGPTFDRRRDAGAFALQNLASYVRGLPPQAVLTPEVYDSVS